MIRWKTMPDGSDEFPWLTLIAVAALVVFGVSITAAFLR